jgi:hypothetical protein
VKRFTDENGVPDFRPHAPPVHLDDEASRAVTCTGETDCACPVCAPAATPLQMAAALPCVCATLAEGDGPCTPCYARSHLVPRTMLSASSPPSCLAGSVTTLHDAAPRPGTEVRHLLHSHPARMAEARVLFGSGWSDADEIEIAREAVVMADAALPATRAQAVVEVRAAAHPRGLGGVLADDAGKAERFAAWSRDLDEDMPRAGQWPED